MYTYTCTYMYTVIDEIFCEGHNIHVHVGRNVNVCSLCWLYMYMYHNLHIRIFMYSCKLILHSIKQRIR